LPGVILCPSAEGDAVIEQHVVADLGGLADYHAHPMVDEEPSADLRAGMDLDAGEPARKLRIGAREEAQAPAPQRMRDPMRPHRVQTRVEETDLQPCSGGRIAQARGDDVLAYSRE